MKASPNLKRHGELEHSMMPSFLSDAQIETTLAIFAHLDESTLPPYLQQQFQQLRSHLLYTSGAGHLDLPSSLPSVGIFPFGNPSVSEYIVLTGFLS